MSHLFSKHFSQIEVFGHEARSHGPISSCAAGKFVTAAVVVGMEDRKGIEIAYKRAISADWWVICHDHLLEHGFCDYAE